MQRVLNALTPFEQRLRDVYSNPAETQASMLALAGPPYAGDVALNMESVSSVGLIQLYQTILNRARRLSLDLGVNDPGVNQQLILAASRLHALYMLLGNEAYADALDPTIGFGSESVDYGSVASSLFCFQNQVPSLLDEELALLRGRGDPSLAPGMGQYPYYNRLVWNFTKGIDAGEVAYSVNYNIHDNKSVVISAEIAAALYPQGHGDAWGHYLGALKGYYHLLRNPHFNWGDPSITPMLIGYQVVSSDSGDEERFAEAASALVRTGTEIARRAYRKSYTEGTGAPITAGVDSDATRAWGASEWTGRAGQAAFYNWAVAQSLLPVPATNDAVEANLTRIDRNTVKSLDEIAANYGALQREADQMDRGLNPLGLAQGAVPFDISPAEIDAGHTHYEQIYDRAVAAVRNAAAAFDGAQEAARLLRQQSESALTFEQAVVDQEADFNNRLLQVFGSPYPEDMGPGGTYPQGYVGPDLFHYAYMDLQALGFDPATEIGQLTITNYQFTATFLDESDGIVWLQTLGEVPVLGSFAQIADMHLDPFLGGDQTPLPSTNLTVAYHFAANGLLAKPAGWGDRASPGEAQQAYNTYLVKLLEFRAGLRALLNATERLDEKYRWYHAPAVGWQDVKAYEQNIANATNSAAMSAVLSAWWKARKASAITNVADVTASVQEQAATALPDTTIVGVASGGSLFSSVKAFISSVGKNIVRVAKRAAELGEQAWEATQLPEPWPPFGTKRKR